MEVPMIWNWYIVLGWDAFRMSLEVFNVITEQKVMGQAEIFN
jgi:hypothetical protein